MYQVEGQAGTSFLESESDTVLINEAVEIKMF